MVFPDGWSRKCKVTIDNTKVVSTLTNFYALLTEDNLPSEIFDADGSYPANADGGDIRFTTDKAGTTQLARHIVEFTRDNDPANGTAQIRVNVPSLSSSTDTDIWIWYHNTGASEPAVGATYGRNNTYRSEIKAIWHLEEIGDGTTDEYIDSSGTDNHGTGGSGTPSKVPDRVVGKIDYGQDFVASTNDFIHVPDHASLQITGAISFGSWVKRDASKGGTILIKSDSVGNIGNTSYGLSLATDGTMYVVLFSSGAATFWQSTASINTDWHHVMVTWDGTTGGGGNVKLYIDGSEAETFNKTDTLHTAAGYPVTLGAKAGGTNDKLDGILDTIPIAAMEFTAGWIGTLYNNENAPDTFSSAGTPINAVDFIPKLMII